MNEIVQRITYEELCRKEALERRTRLFGAGRSKNLIAEQKAREREAFEAKQRRSDRIARLEREAEQQRAFEANRRLVDGISTHGTAHATSSDETYVIDIIEGYFVLGDPPKPSMTSIINAVLEKHDGITIKDIRAPGRKKKVVAARHEAIAAIRRIRPDLSLTTIGRFFNRDHTTILNALRKGKAG